eukprot:1195168-Prorocentrum_minimum.AAC.3
MSKQTDAAPEQLPDRRGRNHRVGDYTVGTRIFEADQSQVSAVNRRRGERIYTHSGHQSQKGREHTRSRHQSQEGRENVYP